MMRLIIRVPIPIPIPFMHLIVKYEIPRTRDHHANACALKPSFAPPFETCQYSKWFSVSRFDQPTTHLYFAEEDDPNSKIQYKYLQKIILLGFRMMT